MAQDFKNIPDHELLTSYQKNDDKKALGTLFERYHHLVTSFCYKYLEDHELAKDATMNIFEKLISEIHKHDVKNFKAWLITVTKNHCLMELRKKRAPLKNIETLELLPMESEMDLHLLEEGERERILLDYCITQLEPRQRDCIVLFYFKQMSYQQIQNATGFSFLEVKSSLQNGKRNIKLLMNK